MELRQLRANANKSREEVAAATDMNRATLYRIETAQARPQVRTLRALMDLYGVPEARRGELLAILKAANSQGWLQTATDLPDQYATYIQFEAEARQVLNYETSFIPGLLQTKAYAWAAISGSGLGLPASEVEHRVAARMARQARRDPPLSVHAIVDEAVLHRSVGGSQVMKAQLMRLQEAAEEPGITLQVIPYGVGAHPGMHGSFVVLSFAENDPDVVYIEGHDTDLFLDNDVDLARYNLVFEHLMAVAASPLESQAVVAAVLADQ
ncbi:helix-turn-helix domain-containing protein [Sinosporangium siamense]|uniref:Transcriptional regulator n=1 Tax=Sinosporangium siamense TaxID=1367973 RepID=A0A919RGS6_9ACTN|nr:helix-turn-helix transcriptional regulator [Sinosporangium siamense]GII93338.1 transcriptional regulator [Sinosporangium siamense]